MIIWVPKTTVDSLGEMKSAVGIKTAVYRCQIPKHDFVPFYSQAVVDELREEIVALKGELRTSEERRDGC